MIYYLTINYPVEKEKEYIEKGFNLQNQARSFQDNILIGFNENNVGEKVVCLNCLSFASWPRNKQLLFKKESYISYGVNHLQIPFLNLPFLKTFCFYQGLKRFLKENIKSDDKIIFYSLYKPFLKIAKYFSKKGIDCTSIVTDLPYPNCAPINNKLAELHHRISYFNYKSYLKWVKNYVLLTKDMVDCLKINGTQQYTIVEGMCSAKEKTNRITNQQKCPSVFLYTGSLDYFSGAFDAVKRFHSSPISNVEFWICGSGEAEQKIKQISFIDKRIRFFGFLPKEEADLLCAKANFLLNPRTPEGNYTRYSFPSKTLEYLASGTPVFMYKLAGVPNEYDSFLNYFDDFKNCKDLFSSILGLDYGDLRIKALKGMHFVLKYKNPEYQVRKILKMMGIL